MNPQSFFVSYINLDKSTDRREYMETQLSKTGVNYERVEAVYGYDSLFRKLSTNETFYGRHLKNTASGRIEADVKYEIICEPSNENSTKLSYAGYPLTTGEVGLLCSNKKAFEYFLAQKNFDYLILLEDDIKILDLDNFFQNIQNIISNAPENVDLVFLILTKYMPNTLYKKVSINEFINSFDSNYEARGTGGIIYFKKGIEKFLSYEAYNDAIDAIFWNSASNPDYQSIEIEELQNGLFNLYESSVELLSTGELTSVITDMGRNYT